MFFIKLFLQEIANKVGKAKNLSAGLVNVLTDIVWKNTISWYAGNGGCKVIRYAQVVVTYASTYALVALSLDRLNAIARPLSFSSDRTRIRVLLSLAWGCSVLFALPMPFINNLTLVQGRWQCWIKFEEAWMWKLYMTTIAVVLFFIPAIIIAVCYSIIVIIIWTKTSGGSGSSREVTTHVKNGTQIYVAANNCRFREGSASSSGVIPRAKMKTIKMTLVIVLVFIICWSPYFVYDLLYVYDYIPVSQNSVALSTFIQSLAPLNSAANPIIYACFNTNMCLDLFRCRFSKRRNNFTHSQTTNYTHFRFAKTGNGTPTIPLYRSTAPQTNTRLTSAIVGEETDYC
ncbi:hypothetical protein EGW08_022618 [Elysia chlorotica]|uniref:G-protein coupled receptors family 1 profile domain-containing protein n=1 Tax=Elysia chlorotica TaxID=188477 RepID=A0A433SKG7_ELYCH|nr:hypothetical protein EGW08_022618 [Elysia chlorotica]